MCSADSEDGHPYGQPTRTPERPPSVEQNEWEELDIKEEAESTTPVQFSRPEWYELLSKSEMIYFCGIPKNCFQSLFTIMTGESLTLPCCNMSGHDQLLLTLCKYKHNYTYSLLGIIFRIEQNDALAVFSFWTYHMFKTLKLYFGVALKAEKNMIHSVSVGIVEVPILGTSSLCAHSSHSDSGEMTSLKSLVVINNDSKSVLFCSKLYGKFTSNESIFQDLEFQQCVALSTSIKVHGSLNVSNLFPDKNIEFVVSDNGTQCKCSGGGVFAGCALSSFQLDKGFQSFMEFYKILSEGIPTGILVMSSEIFYNCLMLLNFSKAFGTT